MTPPKKLHDGLCSPAIELPARQLLSTVCVLGGVACPLLSAQAAGEVLERVKRDPTVAIRLASEAEEVPHHSALSREDSACTAPEDALNRKRDLDVLQRLGLAPGDTRRARYLYELLFQRIATPWGICAHDTAGWEGCPQARSGAYESVREQGWQAVVYARSAEEMAQYRQRSAQHIAKDETLRVRPHHFMCMACWYAGGEGNSPRSNDTIFEIYQRIRREPEVPVTLVEGCCDACDCCDGFHPETGRCVHAGGLIRDYKKDLDVFQKLGLMPGDTLPAREFVALLLERVHSTTEVCGYGDGVATCGEWSVCGGPEGNQGYLKTREIGLF